MKKLELIHLATLLDVLCQDHFYILCFQFSQCIFSKKNKSSKDAV